MPISTKVSPIFKKSLHFMFSRSNLKESVFKLEQQNLSKICGVSSASPPITKNVYLTHAPANLSTPILVHLYWQAHTLQESSAVAIEKDKHKAISFFSMWAKVQIMKLWYKNSSSILAPNATR